MKGVCFKCVHEVCSSVQFFFPGCFIPMCQAADYHRLSKPIAESPIHQDMRFHLLLVLFVTTPDMIQDFSPYQPIPKHGLRPKRLSRLIVNNLLGLVSFAFQETARKAGSVRHGLLKFFRHRQSLLVKLVTEYNESGLESKKIDIQTKPLS